VKALVTGATGFIGGHVVDALLARGHTARALVRPKSDVRRLVDCGVELAQGDVGDRDSVERACRGVDWVFHAAALVGSYGDWSDYERVGVRGTLHVLHGAAKAGAARFVHLGSIAVYGTRQPSRPIAEETPLDEAPEPWNHYVREKVESEKLVWAAHEAGRVRATSLRPSIVLGPRDRNALPRFLAALEVPFGRFVGGLIGRGKNRVPCVVVEDLAELSVLAADNEAAVGRAYNASSEELITQREFLQACADAAGARLRVQIPVPRPLVWASASALETAWKLAGRKQEPVLSRFGVALTGIDVVIDAGRARRELGWSGGRSLLDAIRRSVAWHVEHARA
jgi:nucleoside-diphosphate-sugar epimerase